MKLRPSPNSGTRGAAVDTVILHYTGMRTAKDALDRLRDPDSGVSAHYLIDEDGEIFRLVDESRRAWHAGQASWRGDTDINDRSVGIELVNPGHEFGYRPFPEPQMAALEDLLGDVLRRHRVPPARVLGHSDVAPARKRDPGELFDWPRLARLGLSIWPEAEGAGRVDVRNALEAIGYDAAAPLASAVAAFQRRFVRHAVTGEADPETRQVINAVRRLPDRAPRRGARHRR